VTLLDHWDMMGQRLNTPLYIGHEIRMSVVGVGGVPRLLASRGGVGIVAGAGAGAGAGNSDRAGVLATD
jgi:hypothetical protein